MAPEQAMGGVGIDFRADVHALGGVLFEMLTGQPPFVGDSVIAVAVAHMNAPVPSVGELAPHLSPQVDEVLRRALAKNPRDRFMNALDLSRAAESALGRLVTRTPVTLCRAARQHAQSRSAERSPDGRPATPAPGRSGQASPAGVRTGTSEQMGLVVVLVAAFSDWLEPLEAEGGEDGHR
jgi:serine/threonine-protein kinase